MSHRTHIEQTFIYKKYDKLIIFESGSNHLKIANAHSEIVASNQALGIKSNETIRLKSNENTKNYILHCCINEIDGVIALTSSFGWIYFF